MFLSLLGEVANSNKHKAASGLTTVYHSVTHAISAILALGLTCFTFPAVGKQHTGTSLWS